MNQCIPLLGCPINFAASSKFKGGYIRFFYVLDDILLQVPFLLYSNTISVGIPLDEY